MKKWLNIFLSFILIATLVGTNFFVTAEDTTEEPILILNYEDFLEIADNPSGKYFLVNDIILPEDYPMIEVFSGTLLGNHKSITVNIETTEQFEFIGIFREINSATISNLDIRGSIYNSFPNSYVGGLCGHNRDSSTLTNIRNFATIYNVVTDSTLGTGGIVGGLIILLYQ